MADNYTPEPLQVALWLRIPALRGWNHRKHWKKRHRERSLAREWYRRANNPGLCLGCGEPLKVAETNRCCDACKAEIRGDPDFMSVSAGVISVTDYFKGKFETWRRSLWK